MTSGIKQATSRPFGVAEQLAGRVLEPATVYARTVVLTGETEWLRTRNGGWCFTDSLRLLARGVGHLIVVVPAGLDTLSAEVAGICERTWSIGRIELTNRVPSHVIESAHAILNVGARALPGRPCTTINSEGWVARCSSTRDLPGPRGQDNPIAALMAASFGASEVFKRIFDIPPDTTPPVGLAQFSLYDFTARPTGLGPAFPNSLELKAALAIGGGAIGNGIALLAAQSGAIGDLHFIDCQTYREENLGTSVLLEKGGWLGQSKAKRLAEWVNAHGKLQATGDNTTIEAAIEGQKLKTPRIVINGLDDAGARRESQRLWPDILIDGAINEIGAAVTQYRLAWKEAACLACWFEAPPVDAKTLQSEATGLHRDSLDNLDRELTEEDVAAALEPRRGWLEARRREGKKLCSIITEAQMEARLKAPLAEGFRPSVPFVATAAAALVMAELVKYLAFPEAPSEQLIQLGSLFLGPEHIVSTSMKAKAGCQCVVHADAIRRFRRGAAS
jgi:hypothetical protein